MYTRSVQHEESQRFIIGDVHGCARELHGLLELLAERYGTASASQSTGYAVPEGTIYFVGDLVDRGPDSAEVVKSVRSGVEAGIFRCILGNHDEMLLQNLLLLRPDLVEAAGVDPTEQENLVGGYRWASHRILRHWLAQGGAETIRSYGGIPSDPQSWAVPEEDIAFIARLPLAIHEGGLVLTHAWADSASVDAALLHRDDPWNIPRDTREKLLWNRDPPSSPPAGLHISGHTARREPLVTERAIGLDTGCCFGNRLTAYSPGEEIFLQYPCSTPSSTTASSQ